MSTATPIPPSSAAVKALIIARLSVQLRRRREAVGVSIVDLSRRTGIIERHLRCAEDAKLRGDELGLDQLAALAHALGCSAADLVRSV